MTLNTQRVWTAHKEDLGGGSGVRYEIDLNSQPVTVADVLDGWQHDARFRAFFNSLLANESFAEFRWETPRVTMDTLTKRFEFVVLDSPSLACPPDPTASRAFPRCHFASRELRQPWRGRDSCRSLSRCRSNLLRNRVVNRPSGM